MYCDNKSAIALMLQKQRSKHSDPSIIDINFTSSRSMLKWCDRDFTCPYGVIKLAASSLKPLGAEKELNFYINKLGMRSFTPETHLKRLARWNVDRIVGGTYSNIPLYHKYRYSNLMIQPELEGSTQGYPLVSVEVLRFNTTAGNPVKKILLKLNLSDHRILKDGGGDGFCGGERDGEELVVEREVGVFLLGGGDGGRL
ncbi:hypothetical protein Tco_1345953 [Tanacetum coccineum]